MVKVQINKTENKININFEMPFPLVLLEDEQFLQFYNYVSATKSARFIYIKDHLSGLVFNFQGWIDFVGNFFSAKELAFQKKLLSGPYTKDLSFDSGLSVNFHQKSFDTPLRYWKFILNQGNFIDFFYNRVNWFLYPHYSIVSNFPSHVDLESSSECNMKCPMCYRELMKERGFMDITLFKKAIDECSRNNVFSVRLSWRGETLTHPGISKMIAYACAKIKNVSFLTNAFFINPELMHTFIKNKLSYIAVSFDGIGKTYEAIRKPAKFNNSFTILKELKKQKEKHKSLYPQVRLCTIWPAIKDNPKEYYDTMNGVSDYIVCNPYINFKGPMRKKMDFICQYPWQRIVVGFNGASQCCTGWNAFDIILGNVKNKSIKSMWHSHLMQRIRLLHKGKKRMRIAACAQCRHGATGDPDAGISGIISRRY